MKLYYTGNANGQMKYSLDGTTFIPTTLAALKQGIELPENTDYSKIKVQAGSNVFSSLDVLKNIGIAQPIEGISIITGDPCSNNGDNDSTAYLSTEDYSNFGNGVHLVFKEKSTGDYYQYFQIGKDERSETSLKTIDDFDIVLVYCDSWPSIDYGYDSKEEQIIHNEGTDDEYTESDWYYEFSPTYGKIDASYIHELTSFGPAAKFY